MMSAMRRVGWSVVGSAMFVAATLSGSAVAGSGVGELTLDRAALTAIVSGALPRTVSVELPGLDAVELTVSRVESLRFVEGEVEARVSVRLEAPPVGGAVLARYAPAIDRRTGAVRLEPRSAQAVAPLRLDFDVASWMPAIELPRRWDWSMPLAEGGEVELVVFVQGLEVEEERLRLDLGLAASGSGPAVAGYR